MSKPELIAVGVISDGQHIWLLNPNELNEDYQNQLPNVPVEEAGDAPDAIEQIAADAGLFVIGSRLLTETGDKRHRFLAWFVSVGQEEKTVVDLGENQYLVKRPIGMIVSGQVKVPEFWQGLLNQVFYPDGR